MDVPDPEIAHQYHYEIDIDLHLKMWKNSSHGWLVGVVICLRQGFSSKHGLLYNTYTCNSAHKAVIAIDVYNWFFLSRHKHKRLTCIHVFIYLRRPGKKAETLGIIFENA